MTSSATRPKPAAPPPANHPRLDHLDATRAFALVLGVVFHASLSFMPVFMGWAVQDVSTGPLVRVFVSVSHAFRMELFFLLAGFFSHLTLERKGAGEFVRSRVIRIVAPFVVGWFLLRPLMISGWIMGSASLRGEVDVWTGLVGGFQSLSTLPAGLFTGSHLWFLYYIALITTLVLVARGLPGTTASWKDALVRRADAVVAWLANSPVTLPILAAPTAAALWFMSSWGMDTPDRSLWPHFPALAIYGGFFALGWMLDRQRGADRPKFARLTDAALDHGGRWHRRHARCWAGSNATRAIRSILAAHVAHALGYALTMWSLVFLTIGVFQKLCPRPNAFVRYVADSSYWMYLIHLPVVVWLQVAVAELPLHWSLKLALVSALTVALSLLTYDCFVRSTFVGWVLNGRRRERVLPAWLRGVAGPALPGKPLASSETL